MLPRGILHRSIRSKPFLLSSRPRTRRANRSTNDSPKVTSRRFGWGRPAASAASTIPPTATLTGTIPANASGLFLVLIMIVQLGRPGRGDSAGLRGKFNRSLRREHHRRGRGFDTGNDGRAPAGFDQFHARSKTGFGPQPPYRPWQIRAVNCPLPGMDRLVNPPAAGHR